QIAAGVKDSRGIQLQPGPVTHIDLPQPGIEVDTLVNQPLRCRRGFFQVAGLTLELVALAIDADGVLLRPGFMLDHGQQCGRMNIRRAGKGQDGELCKHGGVLSCRCGAWGRSERSSSRWPTAQCVPLPTWPEPLRNLQT